VSLSLDLPAVINGCHVKIQEILSIEGQNVKPAAIWRLLFWPIAHPVGGVYIEAMQLQKQDETDSEG
jgi:hypothetical protein